MSLLTVLGEEPAVQPAEPMEVPRGGGAHGGAMTTQLSMQRYAHATIKQVVLILEGPLYVETIKRLRRIRQTAGIETNTEAVLAAITAWEQQHGLA